MRTFRPIFSALLVQSALLTFPGWAMAQDQSRPLTPTPPAANPPTQAPASPPAKVAPSNDPSTAAPSTAAPSTAPPPVGPASTPTSKEQSNDAAQSPTPPGSATAEPAADSAESKDGGSGQEEPAVAEESKPPQHKSAPPADRRSASSASTVSLTDDSPAESEDTYKGANDRALVPTKEPPSKMSFDVMLDLTIPLGKTADFISQPGIQGFAVSFRYYVTDRIAVGAGASFDGLSKKSDGTTEYDDLTITGIHTKQLSFTPLLAKAFYAFQRDSKIEPYVAIGVGAALSAQRLVTGYSSFSENQWHFATAPEVGAHLDLGQIVLLGAARLNYLPASGGSVSHTFANVSLGVAIQ